MARKSRVILLGWDGATWDLILPWVEEGELPGIGRMMEQGTWGTLSSTIPPISPAAWTTIFTGVNPGKHGIFGFVKRRTDSYFVTPISLDRLSHCIEFNQEKSVLPTASRLSGDTLSAVSAVVCQYA